MEQTRREVYERNRRKRKERERKRGEGREERRREKRSSAGPRGNYKIAKINHKPDWHTGATIKLVGRPADRRIFLAFTTNHVATRRTSSGIRASLPSREYNPRG